MPAAVAVGRHRQPTPNHAECSGSLYTGDLMPACLAGLPSDVS